MSWKTTNNRNKTTATDVIRCDELIADVIIAENATLNKKITVNRNITLRDLSITDISIATIIAVPDVSVNRIGENTVGGMIEFISPFSAPAAEITTIFATDSSISQLSTADLSVDIIKSTGNIIHFQNTDVSFIGNVKTHDACFNELFTLNTQEINFISDISTNDTIYVSDISVDILRGPIKIEFDDISLHNVQHTTDVSLANNLDVSLFEVMNVAPISGSHLTIHSDVSFHDISGLDLSVDIITIGSIVGDVSVNGNVSFSGQIKAGGIIGHGEIVVTEDASFEYLYGNDISVNNIYGTYLSSDTSLVIYGDISINNTNELRIPMDPRDINQLKKKRLTSKKEFANDTFGIITKNDVYNNLIFRNNIGNFSTVEMNDFNVKDLSISQLTLTDGVDKFTDVSSHTLSGDLSGFSGGFVIGDHGYLVPDNSSVMVRFGLSNEDNVATDISRIDFGDLSGFSGGFSSDNYGYLVPDTSTTLVRYDAINDDVSKIVLNGDLSGFRGGFASDGSGYLVPFLGHKVVSFPLTENSFTSGYVEDISLTDYFTNTDLSGFYGGFSSNNNIFLAPNSHSKLVKIKEDAFDNEELSVNVLDVGSSNSNLKGFTRAFSDGTYGYLVPNNNDSGYHGNVVRFNLAEFSQASMEVLDVGSSWDLKGFTGGFTDGIYGYLVPYHNGYGNHGKVVRFTLASFSQGSVAVLDVASSNSNLKGFTGGFAEGGYGYLVPYHNGGYHGNVVRFNLASFSQASVQVLNVASSNNQLKGFNGGFAEGGYGYLVPHLKNGGYHGNVVRFKLASFSQVEVLDVGLNNSNLRGFVGGFTDGIYGYLVPMINVSGYHGNVVRFNLASFSQVEVLDVGSSNSNLNGFWGGFAEGGYGYIMPYKHGSGYHGNVVRFNLAEFSQASMEVLDVASNNSNLKGFTNGFTDGIYGYLVPKINDSGRHGNVVRFPITTDYSSIDLSFTKSDPDLIGFKGGFAHDNSGYLIPNKNGKVVQFSTSDFITNNINVIDFANLTGDASLVEFSGGFKDETHGYLIPETYNKVARFDLATARIINSLDISVNGKDVSGFSGGFISGDYGYLVPNKSNELVRFSTKINTTKQNNNIINNDDFILDTITIDKNRAYNLRIDFSYLMAIDLADNIPYEDVSMMVEIKPFSDISYFYNYDNSGSAGPGASEDISNVVRITDLSYSEAFNFTFARKSDSDVSMLVTLRDNCNNDTAGNAISRLIKFDVVESNVVDNNFDATYELALYDRDNLSVINGAEWIYQSQYGLLYTYLNSNGIKLIDKVLIEQWMAIPLLLPLYVFSDHTFTNAGRVGRYGPTLSELRDAYSPVWTDDINYLNVTTQGIQEWTVPVSGMYEIFATGARGGNNPGNAGVQSVGGAGADMRGNFELIRGTIIKILCGQMGYDNPISADSGGGGGTFVVIDNNPILVAGGGGGAATLQYAPASTRSDGVEHDAYIGTLAGPNSTYSADNGLGGPNMNAASGAGFLGDGGLIAWRTNFTMAKSFLNGGVGGDSTAANPSVFGGFGGGAAGHGSTCIGGGAGGGYSGGTGGNTQCVFGGGGSSFNSGTNQNNRRYIGDGHGSVYINKL